MKTFDREFWSIAGLVLALALYLLGTTPFGPGLGVIGLLAACLYAIHRLGKGASRTIRIAAGLFAICTVWSLNRLVFDGPIPFWSGSGIEFVVAFALTGWLILSPGWIPAAFMLIYVFLGLVGALRSMVWIMTDDFGLPPSLVFQSIAILLLRFAVIGFLLRAMADGFGNAELSTSEVKDVFD